MENSRRKNREVPKFTAFWSRGVMCVKKLGWIDGFYVA